MAHRVGQRTDGVVEDEQVLVLVLAERVHQRFENETQIGHQFGAGFLLQRSEGRTGRLLHALIAVQYPFQQLNTRSSNQINQ